MKNLKPLFIALSLITAYFSNVQAAAPQTIIQQKQVAGFYQHQMGNVQITALLDGTNFMSPDMFKDISKQLAAPLSTKTSELPVLTKKALIEV